MYNAILGRSYSDIQKMMTAEIGISTDTQIGEHFRNIILGPPVAIKISTGPINIQSTNKPWSFKNP